MREPGDGFSGALSSKSASGGIQTVLAPKGSHPKFITAKTGSKPKKSIKPKISRQTKLSHFMTKEDSSIEKSAMTSMFDHNQSVGEKISFDENQFAHKRKQSNRRDDGTIAELPFDHVLVHEGYESKGKKRKLEKKKKKVYSLELGSREEEQVEIRIAEPIAVEPILEQIQYGEEPDTEDEAISFDQSSFNLKGSALTTNSQHSQHDIDSDEADSSDEVQALLVGEDSGFIDSSKFIKEFTPVPDTQDFSQKKMETLMESPYVNGGATYYQDSQSPSSNHSPQLPSGSRMITTPIALVRHLSPMSSPLTQFTSPLKLSPLRTSSAVATTQSNAFLELQQAWAGQLPPSPPPPVPPKQSKMTDFLTRSTQPLAIDNKQANEDVLEQIMDSQALPGISPAEIQAFQSALKRAKIRRMERVVENLMEEEEDEIEEVMDDQMIISDSQDEQIPLDKDPVVINRRAERNLALCWSLKPSDNFLEAAELSNSMVESQFFPESMLNYLDQVESGFDETQREPWEEEETQREPWEEEE